jgi:hypothetical protein
MVEIKDQPSFESAVHIRLSPKWTILEDLRGGTLSLRAKTTTYLPQFPREADPTYQNRIKESTLTNIYEKTEKGMVGLVFSNPPELGKDVPTPVQAHWEDIDLAGSHGQVFLQDVFEDSFDGYAFIVVDFPAGDPSIKSLADEKASNRRPYWTKYCASQAYNARFGRVNNRQQLTQITFRECTFEADGEFKEKEVVRYRRWMLIEADSAIRAAWELYKETKNDAGETVYIPDGDGVTSLSEIPCAIVGEYGEDPPLIDLALKNIQLYQLESDYHKAKHIAGIEIFWVRNLAQNCKNTQGNVTVGQDVLWEVEGDGEVGVASPTGAALASQREALEDIKKDCQMLGMSLLLDQSGKVTATEALIDNAQETSVLASMALSLKDAAERALGFHAQYMSLESGGQINLGVAWQQMVLTVEEMTFWLTAVDSGRISQDTFWAILKRGGKLPEEFTAETERTRIASMDVIPTVTQ